MTLEVLTPQKKVFSGEVDRVQMPGSHGLFEVLKDHAPLIASLKDGIVKITDQSGVESISIIGGFVEVLNNQITILAEGISKEDE